MLSKICSYALSGIEGFLVEVEVDIDFDDILDEYGDEVTEFIQDKILSQKDKFKSVLS